MEGVSLVLHIFILCFILAIDFQSLEIGMLQKLE